MSDEAPDRGRNFGDEPFDVRNGSELILGGSTDIRDGEWSRSLPRFDNWA